MPHPARLAHLLGLSLGLCLSTAGAAEPAGLSLEEALGSLVQAETATASRFSQPASQAPAAVSVVTAEDIRVFGYRTLSDILKGIRGLYVNNDRNYSYVGVRGFGRPGDYNGRLLVLVDGVAINENVYDSTYPGNDFLIDVDLIERVEYVPGPGSAVYGNKAFFGTLNILTKDPAQLSGNRAALELADHGGRLARASVARVYESGMQLLLAVAASRSDGEDLYFPEFDSPASHQGIARGLDSEDTRHVYGKFRHDDLELAVIHAHRDKGMPTAAFGQVFGEAGAHTTDEHLRLDLKYRFQLADWPMVARLYRGAYDYSGDYILDYPPVTLNRDLSIGRWWGTELHGEARTLGNHTLVWGGDYQRDSEIRQVNFDVAPWASYLDDRRQGERWGVFLQDSWQFAATWQLIAGLRQDRAATGENALHPRLALIHSHPELGQLKLIHGTAFRAPNAYERYYSPGGAYILNPNLRSETIENQELVWERAWSDRRYAASLYRYHLHDLVELTATPDPACDGGICLGFSNLSEVEGQGLELEAEHHWSGGAWLRASYTWQLAQRENGDWLDNSPRHLAKLHYSLPLAGGRWQAGLEAQYQSARRTYLGNTLAGGTSFNLTLGTRHLAPGLDLSLSVHNLLDTDLAIPPSDEHFDSLGRALTGIPQEGRTWRIKLDYRF